MSLGSRVGEVKEKKRETYAYYDLAEGLGEKRIVDLDVPACVVKDLYQMYF